MLVRRERGSGGKEQWLLLHKHDEHAVPGWDPEDHPRVGESGRTNDEVTAAPDALWHSDVPAAEAEAVRAPDTTLAAPTDDELAALDALGDDGTWTVAGPGAAS